MDRGAPQALGSHSSDGLDFETTGAFRRGFAQNGALSGNRLQALARFPCDLWGGSVFFLACFGRPAAPTGKHERNEHWRCLELLRRYVRAAAVGFGALAWRTLPPLSRPAIGLAGKGLREDARCLRAPRHTLQFRLSLSCAPTRSSRPRMRKTLGNHLAHRWPTLAWVALSITIGLVQPAAAQSTELALGTTAARAGRSVEISVTLTPGATPVSMIQFDLVLPDALSLLSVTAGAAASAAAKTVQGVAKGRTVRVIVFGLNQTPIDSGAVAALRMSIASGTAPGELPLGLSGIVASSPTAEPVATTSTNGAVTVTAPLGQCGNNTLEEDETCDPPTSCPATCADDDSCTISTLIGRAEDCTAACEVVQITLCQSGDGCCPDSCIFPADRDCTPPDAGVPSSDASTRLDAGIATDGTADSSAHRGGSRLSGGCDCRVGQGHMQNAYAALLPCLALVLLFSRRRLREARERSWRN